MKRRKKFYKKIAPKTLLIFFAASIIFDIIITILNFDFLSGLSFIIFLVISFVVSLNILDKYKKHFRLWLGSLLFIIVAVFLPSQESPNIIPTIYLTVLNALAITALIISVILAPKYIFKYLKSCLSLLKSATNYTLKAIKTKPILLFYAFLLIAVSATLLTIRQNSKDLASINLRLEKVENKLGGSKELSCDEKLMIEKVKKSIVRVVGGISEGSGVIVKANGLIATNHHVIQFEPAPKVVFPDYSFEPATILMADKESDLALIKIERENLDSLSFDTSAKEKLSSLQTLLAFGFPLGTTLPGEASVQQGRFVSFRTAEGLEYIQTDLSLNPGQSGGALTDACGNLVGINRAGIAGLGMAISASSALDTWFDLLNREDPLQDVVKLEFKPNDSPPETVRAFYNYQKARKLEEAYKLLSDNFLRSATFENWKRGYEPLIDTYLIEIKDVENKKDTVFFKLMTKELIGEEIVVKYFEGTWEVRKIDGNFKLWDPEIKEVQNPDWSWFYPK